MRPRAFAIAAAVLIAAGTFFSVRFHTVFDSRTQTWRHIEDRYRDVLAALPPQGRVLYLSDHQPYDWWVTYRLHAQYALAPHLLVDSGAEELALADLKDPKSLARLLPAGYERIAAAKDGSVVLFKRVAR